MGLKTAGIRLTRIPAYALLTAAWMPVTVGAGPPVELRLERWTAIIEPDTLTLRARLGERGPESVVATGARISGVTELQSSGSARWKLGNTGITAEFSVRGNRLRARFNSAREQRFDWPRTGESAGASALILPEGEGLFVPVAEPAWRRRLTGKCYTAYGGLSMPFWSYWTGQATFSYEFISDLRSDLCLADPQGRLRATARHWFEDRDGRPAYELEMWPGGSSPISPALEYRDELQRNGLLKTLPDKIRANPEAAKLLGAIHMYVWGDGRSLDFLNDLSRAGIRRAWIGFDQNGSAQEKFVDKDYIAKARELGYLAGPYDTFSNAQDPITGEDATSLWPGHLYPEGCIRDRDRKIHSGFAGRGCELSSEALERAEPVLQPMAHRIADRLRDGANSYFLDVDAYGDLYDDFSPSHPMTPSEDRQNRLRRMANIRNRGVVLGSEEGVGWSVSVLDFAHGALSVQNQVLWNDKRAFGGWWPPDRPAIFFRPVDPAAEFTQAKYDPAYRLPLYEAVFHDSVVATDRWDVPLAKFPALMNTRQLLESLYGVPSMWAMDRRQLRESAAVLAKLARFFEPLHGRLGLEPLSQFAWLTGDRMVQQTTFGQEAVLTANFGSPGFEAVQAGCIQVLWRATRETITFCPGK